MYVSQFFMSLRIRATFALLIFHLHFVLPAILSALLRKIVYSIYAYQPVLDVVPLVTLNRFSRFEDYNLPLLTPRQTLKRVVWRQKLHLTGVCMFLTTATKFIWQNWGIGAASMLSRQWTSSTDMNVVCDTRKPCYMKGFLNFDPLARSLGSR